MLQLFPALAVMEKLAEVMTPLAKSKGVAPQASTAPKRKRASRAHHKHEESSSEGSSGSDSDNKHHESAVDVSDDSSDSELDAELNSAGFNGLKKRAQGRAPRKSDHGGQALSAVSVRMATQSQLLGFANAGTPVVGGSTAAAAIAAFSTPNGAGVVSPTSTHGAKSPLTAMATPAGVMMTPMVQRTVPREQDLATGQRMTSMEAALKEIKTMLESAGGPAKSAMANAIAQKVSSDTEVKSGEASWFFTRK